ncbi:MAG: hydrogenase expression/formation protein HypE [Bacteroidetes bacterium HGW-Bacteroidetes-21]|nr:MAG: hydrogenase expression/formation protein HypE [Bacteroidetes bacterium HGW-Bacteroidetes-21]
MEKNVLLGHGSGGKLSHDLIKQIFVKHFDNEILRQQTDAALLKVDAGNIAFTTDSYVVDPIFFPGGNIGKLAVCGTVNDLSVSGATPKYISAAFIIEEGFPLSDLETIVETMALEAKKAGVLIVTGDTKVVNKGQCDKVFINTAGIGVLEEEYKEISFGKTINPGDKIIVNGTIADHGMAIMASRNFGNFKTDITSDCACLNGLIKTVLDSGCKVKFMRDATRGGLATVLCELSESGALGIEINETSVLVNENVRGICELLGFDPFYVANEGKIVLVADNNDAEKVLAIMQSHELGKQSSIIGEFVTDHAGKTILNTEIGGKRIIDMLAGEQLPRIC